MAARLWTALLVLVVVFVMHGAKCTAAADDVGHPSPAAHFTVPAPAGTLMHGAAETAAVITATGLAPVVTVLADTTPATHPATVSPAAVAADDSPSSDSHGTAGHLWTVCLAVLAAALAVLLALLLPHPGLLARLAPPRVRARLRSLSPPRPPDLSELCLLRI
jgi:hypothetical protein